jgi:hypothetical protein
MELVIIVLGLLCFLAFLIGCNNESEYLGRNSTLKLMIEEKEAEIDELKNEIYRLKHNTDVEV